MIFVTFTEAKLKTSDIGFIGNNINIYFNDHLTGRNKEILNKAKAVVKENNYYACLGE